MLKSLYIYIYVENWRLKFLIIQEKGTAIEQVREEEKIKRVFLQKIRSYEEGRGEGVKLEFEHIPRIGEERSPLYEGIIRLMLFIDNMVSWDSKALITETMKIVIKTAAGLTKKKETENLTRPDQRSGEEYAKRVLQFLEEEEAKENKISEEGETIELYPKGD